MDSCTTGTASESSKFSTTTDEWPCVRRETRQRLWEVGAQTGLLLRPPEKDDPPGLLVGLVLSVEILAIAALIFPLWI